MRDVLWSAKRPFYRKGNAHNRKLTEANTEWPEAQIEKRAVYLGEAMIVVWPGRKGAARPSPEVPAPDPQSEAQLRPITSARCATSTAIRRRARQSRGDLTVNLKVIAGRKANYLQRVEPGGSGRSVRDWVFATVRDRDLGCTILAWTVRLELGQGIDVRPT